ncbi:MAG: OmpH family outer membrane protein [Bacteroidota bacterium]
MKKLLFVCVAVAASLLFTNTTKAQATKIGYFDEQLALQLFPGIDKVQTQLDSYQNDSLRLEFEARVYEFQKADSVFKKDSATMPAKVRELAVKDLNQKKYTLANWQQIAQQMYEGKMDQLLNPFRQKVADALRAVVAEQKYTIVLNAAALTSPQYVQPPLLDNLAIKVAIKLKLPLTKEIEDAWKAAGGSLGTSAPATAPKK